VNDPASVTFYRWPAIQQFVGKFLNMKAGMDDIELSILGKAVQFGKEVRTSMPGNLVIPRYYEMWENYLNMMNKDAKYKAVLTKSDSDKALQNAVDQMIKQLPK
jgi:hypothetical protein